MVRFRGLVIEYQADCNFDSNRDEFEPEQIRHRKCRRIAPTAV